MAEDIKKEEIEEVSKKTAKRDYIFAVGRRKEAVARVRLYTHTPVFGDLSSKKGDIFVNGKKISDYFGGKISEAIYTEPLKITNTLDKYVFSIKVLGGGQSGQLDACIHGIARVLSSIDLKNRQILKKKGYLTRDARVRERRKVGMGGKARRKKQSPKR